jgi:hypothetical protein
MAKSKESKAIRDKRVSRMLDTASSSSVAVAARAFRDAGLKVELGRFFSESDRDHHGIELIASAHKKHQNMNIEASWHVAHAPGHDGVLVVLNEAAEDKENETIGFRPLANEAFDQLLARTWGKYTGVGLLDAPKVKADGLLEVLGERGVGGKDYLAMMRALNSALHAMQPQIKTFREARPTYRFAAPMLVTEAVMYEACATVKTSHLADTCYIALEHQHQGARTVDVIGLDFIATYARMAAEAVDALPRLIEEQLDDPTPIKQAEGQDLISAWDAFREL